MTSAVAKRGDEQDVLVYATQAQVRAVGEATDQELLALIKKKAPDASIFDKVAPYMFQAEASNGGLDAYYTRMDDRSLRNYAKDADAGVMFLDSHDKRQLGFGQSIRGQFLGSSVKVDERVPDDKDLSRVLIDFYTVPGLQLGRASSDSFILGVQTGIIHDVSIGFIPDAFECNICRNDPFDWWSMECMHIPGAYYDSTGKNVVTSKSQGAILAFAWVRNARLSEVSAVYDGATPGAYIQKAHYLVEAGEVSRHAATMLERQLRIKLPTQPIRVPTLGMKDGKLVVEQGSVMLDGLRYSEDMEVRMGKQSFRRLARQQDDESIGDQVIKIIEEDEAAKADDGDESVELTPEEAATVTVEGNDSDATDDEPVAEDTGESEEGRMTPEEIAALQERVSASDTMVRRIREVLARTGWKDAETADPAQVIEDQARQIADLTPRAKMGDDYRSAVTVAALDAGVRALGDGFKRTDFEGSFNLMSVDQIRLMGETWEKMVQDGKSNIPVGGRRTADIGTATPNKNGRSGGAGGDLAQYSTPR
jgi:hypothetical protein